MSVRTHETDVSLFEAALIDDTEPLAPRILKDSPSQSADTPFVYDHLTQSQKLEVLWDDERTRFVPSHNDEKSEALNILAFLSDPERHPGGIHDHLMEVFQRHKSIAREKGTSITAGAIKGSSAVQSILFTYADYFNSAELGYQNLGKLETTVDGCMNPKISLEQLLSDDHDGDISGVAELVRFIDIVEPTFDNICVSRPGFSPLITKEQRFEKPVDGKNKLVHDRYTADQLDLEVADHIQTVMSELTVGSLRQLLPRVRGIEHNRAVFWSRVLRARYYEYQVRADKALRTTSLVA